MAENEDVASTEVAPPTIEDRLSVIEQNILQLRAMLHDYEHVRNFVGMMKAQHDEAVKQFENDKTRALIKKSNSRIRIVKP